jgi:hypothetical protein
MDPKLAQAEQRALLQLSTPSDFTQDSVLCVLSY